MTATDRANKGSANRLNIGGMVAKDGWRILNVQPGDGVDFVGNVADLSGFANEEFDEVYASHVIEHLGFRTELPAALSGIYRILKPGGVFQMSVPDLEVLCRIFLNEGLEANDRFKIMSIMFGGQTDAHDFHKVGLTWEFAQHFLGQAGYERITRVREFGVFADASGTRIGNVLISLNVEARKAPTGK
jgi:predicted SAM-dependent methyltransferase